VEKQGQAVVVEWQEGKEPRRCILPKRLVIAHKGNLSAEVLKRGIPYGMDWAELLVGMITPTPADVERELHKIGIWTEAQLRANMAGARRAVDAACSGVLIKLIRGAKAACRAS